MEMAGMDPVLGLGLFAFALLLLALPLAFWKVSSEKTSGLVTLLIATANLALTAQLVFRWWQSGHFPISNLYESLCFLAWACTLTQLLVERSWPTPIVAASATPMGLGCIAFASFALPDQLQEASPLVPALRSSWLVMHVSVIMVSYAALLVGSLLSVAVLVTDRGHALELRSSSIGSGGYRRAALATPLGSVGEPDVQLSSVQFTRNELLDSLSYRTKNQAESLIYQAEKQVEELGKKVSPEAKTKVELVLTELKEAVSSDDTQRIKDRVEGVQTALMEMGASVYSGEEQAPTTDTSSSDEPIDAEFIDV